MCKLFYIYTKETLTELKGETRQQYNKSKDFNAPLSIIDRIYTQLIKETENLKTLQTN